MGNQPSSELSDDEQQLQDRFQQNESPFGSPNNNQHQHTRQSASTPTRPKTFPGSALLDGTVMLCGIDTTQSADQICISTPPREEEDIPTTDNSKLFARALVSEVTDNPNTMTPAKMAEREKKLLKAQGAAKNNSKAVGVPGGVGQPSLLGSLAHALGGPGSDRDMEVPSSTAKKTVEPPSSMQENRAQLSETTQRGSKHRITVGLSLSRRHSTVGHADTVTRQTAFDFNELQDREYKYVSSTDASGWRAGGGERGGSAVQPSPSPVGFDEEADYYQTKQTAGQTHKVAAPDIVHIPIIHIDAESPEAVDHIIAALARGEVFIPHMSVLPEALSVNGISPPDLVVRFGCERNDDATPDEWPNWCLEFMHNQLYEYFANYGAKWMKRPFQITLAKKVRWKTVKHMNRYFAHAERVLDAWREKGPQYLDPQLSYIEGGATPEEVARPHGIYLLRNGVPTNYFAPNFDPPYTTKMTRSLLTNVLDKSWDKKRREWTSEPVPRLVTPATLITNLCGCTDAAQGGFMANHVTTQATPSETVVDTVVTLDDDPQPDEDPVVPLQAPPQVQQQQRQSPQVQQQRQPSPRQQSPRQTANRESPHQESPRREKSTSPAQQQQQQQQSSPTRRVSPRRGGTSPSLSATEQQQQQRRTPTPEVAMSEVAPSATTVPHMNYALNTAMSPTNSEINSQTPENKKKKKSSEKKNTADLTREIAKVALTQNADDRPSVVEEARRDPRKMELAQAVADYEEKKSDSSTPRYGLQSVQSSESQSVQRTDSNISLEYSMDSSLLGGGDSSITGHYFQATENGSVSTSNSRFSKNSLPKKNMLPRSVDDDTSLLSGDLISETGVPSDQDLFAVGWAKALDAKSGSYYYFTLDRSKIVWDNPLTEKSVFSSSTATTSRQSSTRG